MLWTSEPMPLEREDYDRTTEDFLRVAGSTPGVLGVWQTGSVSVPGISDLDFILVVRNRTRLSWNRVRKRLSPESTRVLLHSPVALPESLVPWLGYVNDTRATRRLTGPEIPFAEPANRGMVNILVAARFTMAKLLGLERTAFMGVAGVRSLLCRVHGLRHNFTLMDRPVPPLFDEVTELRESWFSMGEERFSRLEELLAGATDACVALLREIPVPGVLESGSDELAAENWRFYGGKDRVEKKGLFSWLPRKGRLGEIAYYSTWFELGVAPGLSGLLAGTLSPDEGREDWEKHLEIIGLCEGARGRLPGFSPAAPLLSLRGWRRWVP